MTTEQSSRNDPPMTPMERARYERAVRECCARGESTVLCVRQPGHRGAEPENTRARVGKTGRGLAWRT